VPAALHLTQNALAGRNAAQAAQSAVQTTLVYSNFQGLSNKRFRSFILHRLTLSARTRKTCRPKSPLAGGATTAPGRAVDIDEHIPVCQWEKTSKTWKKTGFSGIGWSEA
jgi:hypothetical protein